jgi:Xaa-Pro dipeptidase
MPAFERAEYLERIARTKRLMEERGIEVLFLSNASNMCYVSGYDAASDYVPQGIILPIDEEEPYWIGRGQDAACALYTVFFDPDRIYGYSEAFIGNPDKHAMVAIADYFREHGWDKCRVGVEDMSASSRRVLERELPNTALIDADLLVDQARFIKSDAEIVYMRQASQIADLAMRAGVDMIEEGVRQNDAAAEILRALTRGTDEFGGGFPDTLMMPKGEQAAAPHISWTDEPFKRGEMVNIELGGYRHRYACALSRTVAVGEPPVKLVELDKVVREAMDVALDTARPGATCEQIEAAWQKVVNAGGFEKRSRIGYSIGLDWLEPIASLQPGDTTVLQPNMTFHLMQGMWHEGWGYVLSAVFRVTDNGGPEVFSTFPRDLIVKR